MASKPTHSPPHSPDHATTPTPFTTTTKSKTVTFDQLSPPTSPSSPNPSAAHDPMNEQSPLLSPTQDDDNGLKRIPSPLSDDDWNPEAGEDTKSSWYLLLLTLGGLGLQIAWSVELSYGSPYLISLGLSKSLLALVWIAGPLSGTLVQPYVGLKSDNCRSRWGKRRPFIIGGAAATIVSLFLLAWARELVGGLLGIFGVARDASATQTLTILFAVLMVYVLDFAINVIQAAIRAFVVDCAPTHQQEAANAWIMRTSGTGNILGYLSGFVNLPKYFPFLGDSQMKVLCAIACLVLAVTVTISCTTISERDPRSEGVPDSHGGLLGFFKNLFRSIKRLPPQISKVCQVQLAAWIGWFPFLFYATTYIGEIYTEPYFEANPHMSDADINQVWEEGTRMGTLALFIFALTTFACSIILPLLVAPTYKAPSSGAQTPSTPLTPSTPRSSSIASSSYFPLPSGSTSHKRASTSGFASHFRRLPELLDALQIQSLTLRRAWLFSHIMFTVLMWSTLLVRSTAGATLIVALVGVPWAVANWAPFSLISSEISKRDAIRRGLIRPDDDDDDTSLSGPSSSSASIATSASRDANLLASGEDAHDGADQAGVVLGIHNVAIAAPQVVATLVSSTIFRFLQKPRGSPGDASVAWVLRFGGLCALVAAWLTTRVAEERRRGGGVVLGKGRGRGRRARARAKGKCVDRRTAGGGGGGGGGSSSEARSEDAS
ncbi:uncharacterized protein IWZ02DRAFT_272525 [Phyllosticta citriasiana]|uniref:Sucrose transporter n=1 Tax=Phyllosticta citriasiana TaxID=595635 RepID=A0ABR1L1T7_9PEZI